MTQQLGTIVYLVCASVTGSSTSNSNSNKFHKWTRANEVSDTWTHTWGRIGTPGQTQQVTTGKVLSKMRDALAHGYQAVEVAAGGGAVNTATATKSDLRDPTIRVFAGDNAELRDLVTMLVDRNTREIVTGTTLTMNAATGLFETDGGVVVTRAVVDQARDILQRAAAIVDTSKASTAKADQIACEYLTRIPTNIGRDRPTFARVFPDAAAISVQSGILDALLASLCLLYTSDAADDL
jgi:hypothetical protein